MVDDFISIKLRALYYAMYHNYFAYVEVVGWMVSQEFHKRDQRSNVPKCLCLYSGGGVDNFTSV